MTVRAGKLDAVILAGGLGTRLQAVVSDRPKPMALLNGVPFIDLLLHQLAGSGLVRSVVLAVGYKAEFVREAFAGGERFGLPVRLTFEDAPLGTGGALLNALPCTLGDTILVLNGDSYVELDYQALLETHLQRNASVTIALTRTEHPERYGTVERDLEGRVLAFREKVHAAPGPACINAGVYLFRRAILESAPQARPLSIEKDLFPAFVGSIWSVLSHGRFIDIGLPETYVAAQYFLEDLIAATRGDITPCRAS